MKPFDSLTSSGPPYSVLVVGEQQTPVVVIDNSSVESPKLDVARWGNTNSGFQFDKGAYPGIKAPLPLSYVENTVRRLVGIIGEVYGVEKSQVEVFAAFFGVILQPEDQLTPLQRIPHFDSFLDDSFAILHYLSPRCFGGTGFFRHKPTGIEVVHSQNVKSYVSARQKYLDQNGLPRQQYITTSTDEYELIEQVNYMHNRVLVYPSGLLHSGLINPPIDLHCDPRNGRLTANVFIRFK